MGRRSPREENSPCEVEDCLIQQGQGSLGCYMPWNSKQGPPCQMGVEVCN